MQAARRHASEDRRGRRLGKQRVVVSTAAPSTQNRSRRIALARPAATPSASIGRTTRRRRRRVLRMAQAFLHAQQHGRGPASLGVDDPVRRKTNRVKCWRKQVRPLQHPQHLAREPGQNAPRSAASRPRRARHPVPPPATPCKAPSAKPPPGRWPSTAPTPNGRAAPTVFAGRPTWAMLALSAAKRAAVV